MVMYPATYVYPATPLSSFFDGFFIISFIQALTGIDLIKIDYAIDLVFSSEDMIDPGVFRMFLSKKQADYLHKNKLARLYSLPKQQSYRLLSRDETYLV